MIQHVHITALYSKSLFFICFLFICLFLRNSFKLITIAGDSERLIVDKLKISTQLRLKPLLSIKEKNESLI